MPERPDTATVISATTPDTDAVARVEHEVTVLMRRSLEEVWAEGYGDHDAVDRYTYSVLALLDMHGALGLTELTARLGLSKPTASRHVARLAAARLVATEPDGRALRVALTDGGVAQVRQVRATRRERLAGVLRTWSDGDNDALAVLLHRLNTDLDRHRRFPA